MLEESRFYEHMLDMNYTMFKLMAFFPILDNIIVVERRWFVSHFRIVYAGCGLMLTPQRQ
jgi:hypothetical protein